MADRDERAVAAREPLAHQERSAGDQAEARRERDPGPRGAEQHREGAAQEGVADDAHDAPVRRRHVADAVDALDRRSGVEDAGAGGIHRPLHFVDLREQQLSVTARDGSGAVLALPACRDEQRVGEDEHFALGQAVDASDVAQDVLHRLDRVARLDHGAADGFGGGERRGRIGLIGAADRQ